MTRFAMKTFSVGRLLRDDEKNTVQILKKKYSKNSLKMYSKNSLKYTVSIFRAVQMSIVNDVT